MGGGAPPSAKVVVDMAPSSTNVTSIKRTIFFTKPPYVRMTPLRKTIFFVREEIQTVRKTRGRPGSSSVYRQPQSRLHDVELTQADNFYDFPLVQPRRGAPVGITVNKRRRSCSSSVNRRMGPCSPICKVGKSMLRRGMPFPQGHPALAVNAERASRHSRLRWLASSRVTWAGLALLDDGSDPFPAQKITSWR